MGGFESRRRFLERSCQGMVWLSGGALAACGGGGTAADAGGGGGTGGGSGGGGAGSEVSPALRAATLESVRASVASLAAGAAAFDSAALVRALQALPALSRVGTSSAVGNLWAQFTDGRYLVVPNNLQPAAAAGTGHARPQAAATATTRRRLASGDDMPNKLVAQQYRQLDMLGQVPASNAPDAAHLCQDGVGSDTLPQLRRMAQGCGFMLPAIQTSAPPDAGVDNGVDGLTVVSGDGVFFITACAAQVGSDDTPRTVICSGTPATEANLARHEADLARGALVYAVALRGVQGAWQPVPCLAFGPEFVQWYGWRFPAESVAIFNLSGAPGLSEWIEPLRRAGVRHVMGWARPVSWQRLLAFGDDLIQLNLATNNLDGRHRRQEPAPRLRSYGVGETLGHLMRRGVASDGGAGDAMFYLQEHQPALMVNSLLPTIDYASFNENTLALELVGQFGRAAAGSPLAASPSAPPSATLPAMIVSSTRDSARFAEPLLARAADPLLDGHMPLASPQWEGELLRSVLGRDDLERGGYLQVVNGGRCSNVVPITHWEVPIQAVSTIDELTLSITVYLRLRSDVHAWRLGPDDFARNGAVQTVLNASVHSRATYTASGSISRYEASTRTRTTITWSGSGGLSNAPGDFSVNFSAVLLWSSLETQLVTLDLRAAGATYTQVTVTEQFDVNNALLRRTEESAQVPVSLSAGGPGPNGALQMRLDAQWRLLGGSFEMLPVDSSILPAPPQRVLRTRLDWPLVQPDYPPRPDYGGT